MATDKDVELLYEIGTLRFIDRAWKQFLGSGVANLADHHFRVAWIAMLLAKYEPGVNIERLLKMALVHDLAESRTGDAHHMSRLYVKRYEDLAIEDILKGSSVGEEMIQLWHEYEKRESLEAKLVKDADFLDVDLELQEYTNGTSLKERLIKIREQSVYPRLYTDIAKKFWKKIHATNANDWHILGKNRYTAGDWKDPV